MGNYCFAKGILFNSYSPLGIPDWHTYPSGKLIDEKRLKPIAEKHGLSPAQVLLTWQHHLGIPMNPRTQNLDHMKENLSDDMFNAKLSDDDLKVLQNFTPDRCGPKNLWYECCGDPKVQASIPKCE